MKKLISAGVASVAALALGLSGAASASAATYSGDENRAWAQAKKHDPYGTRLMGKETTVDFMNYVCSELDDGTDMLDIAGLVVDTALEANMSKESQDGFIDWASTSSAAAVVEMCDHHRSDVMISLSSGI